MMIDLHTVSQLGDKGKIQSDDKITCKLLNPILSL